MRRVGRCPPDGPQPDERPGRLGKPRRRVLAPDGGEAPRPAAPRGRRQDRWLDARRRRLGRLRRADGRGRATPGSRGARRPRRLHRHLLAARSGRSRRSTPPPRRCSPRSPIRRCWRAPRLTGIYTQSLLQGQGTLYVVAPTKDQERLAPLFAGLVEHVIDAAYARAAAGRPCQPPLLVVLDEAANTAPIRTLPQIAATAAGQGMQW